MGTLFRRLFNIERHETARALWMFLYAFLLLSAYLILKPVRNSLFLNKFGADQLVYMYMIVAATATPIAALYGWTAARTTLPRLVGGTTIIIVLNLAVFWYLIGHQFSWLVYVFYVWVSLFGVFTTSQFWLLANYVFDPREAKRIFPFIAAGAITGGLSGSLLTGLFAELIGTENLLWLCVVFMAACLGILQIVWRSRSVDAEKRKGRQKKNAEVKGMLPIIFQSRHLTLLALMISLTVMVSTFVDFQFNKVVQSAFDDKDKLTAFFGIFFFWLSLASLFLQLLFSSRILRRFGVGAAILFLPFGLLLGSAAIFLFPVLASAILVKLSDGSFRYSINKTGLELLYLPVPATIKSRVKAFMDVVGDRFARGVGGGLLYLVTNVLAWPVQWISFLSAVLISAWVAVALLIRREYSQTFRAALDNRLIDASEIAVQLQDAASVEVVARTLETGDKRQILFALELVADDRSDLLAQPLTRLLDHDDCNVRLKALKLLGQLTGTDESQSVRPLLNDSDPAIQSEAVRYLCSHAPDSGKMFSELASSGDTMLQVAAFRCASEHAMDEQAAGIFDRSFLERLTADRDSDRVEIRRRVAWTLRYLPPDHPAADLIPGLMADRDAQTRRFALAGTAAMKKTEYLPVIIGYLGDSRLRHLATEALLQFGPVVLDELAASLTDPLTPSVVKFRLPRVISMIPDEKAVEVLVSGLEDSNQLLRHNLIRGLNRIRNRLPSLVFEKDMISRLIVEESRGYYQLASYLEATGADDKKSPARALLLKTLSDRQRMHLDQAFRLAGLIYPAGDMLRAYQGVTSGAKLVRARAIEFLDTVWDQQEKRYLFPILEKNLQLDEAGRQLFRLPELGSDEAIGQLLIGPDSWLAACSAFVVETEGLGQFISELEDLRERGNEVAREAARSALEALRN